MFEHHRDTLDDFIQWFSSQSTSAAIADIGCSSGFFLAILRELGFANITGYDISEYAVQLAIQKGLNCIACDVLVDGISSRKFDIVLLMDVLEHLPHPDQALLRIRSSILHEKGILFLTAPIYDSLPERITRLLRRMKKLEQATDHDPTHLHAFSEISLHALLRASGYRIMDSRRLHCPIPRLHTSRGRIVVQKLLPYCCFGKFIRITASPC